MRTIIFLFAVTIVGCSPNIDVLKTGSAAPVVSRPANDVTLSFYKDYNLFQFMSNMTYSMDSEKLHAKHFELKLPKGLKYYEFSNATDFAFYYGSNQVVFVKIDLAGISSSGANMSLISKTVGIDKLLESAQTNGNKKYNLKDIKSSSERSSLQLEGSNVKIILYNIKQDRFQDFKNQVESFRFVE